MQAEIQTKNYFVPLENPPLVIDQRRLILHRL